MEKRGYLIVGVIIIFLLILISFRFTNKDTENIGQTSEQQTEPNIELKLELESQSFTNNAQIPLIYTCDGEDISPPLEINNIPENTKSLVLIVDDPEKTWVHWVVWNIPMTNLIQENSVPQGAIQGINDFGEKNYRGPCPPSGTHRYFFKLYALDSILDLEENSDNQELETTMQDYIIDQTELIGLYGE
ncbi:YbhB/YbcL family Raf kinase inhibitor-like protein [Nanoarchaeota archaeon]